MLSVGVDENEDLPQKKEEPSTVRIVHESSVKESSTGDLENQHHDFRYGYIFPVALTLVLCELKKQEFIEYTRATFY